MHQIAEPRPAQSPRAEDGSLLPRAGLVDQLPEASARAWRGCCGDDTASRSPRFFTGAQRLRVYFQ